MDDLQILKDATGNFLASCGRDYVFPAGGTKNILTSSEHALLSSLSSQTISDVEKIKTLSEGLDWDACYSIVTFGVRLAILAVRSKQQHLFGVAVIALAAGSPKVDWRDVLGIFAVFEYCGARLGVEFQDHFESVVRFTDESKLRPTMDGYFSRPTEMRTLAVMGFRRIGSDNEMSFSRT